MVAYRAGGVRTITGNLRPKEEEGGSERERERERDALNCTVFSAATSHPSDCMLNTAILLPTYLGSWAGQCQRTSVYTACSKKK